MHISVDVGTVVHPGIFNVVEGRLKIMTHLNELCLGNNKDTNKRLYGSILFVAYKCVHKHISCIL